MAQRVGLDEPIILVRSLFLWENPAQEPILDPLIDKERLSKLCQKLE